MVSVEGFEPSILSASELKSDVYSSSTTRPYYKVYTPAYNGWRFYQDRIDGQIFSPTYKGARHNKPISESALTPIEHLRSPQRLSS